ncbi:MAG: 3-keto-5-aminohexanoate cleavage protein [Bacilli bacterium]|nr:3-keto-5-aminohexanoate cleavage protein [Bacilli bacterium]MBN2876434.1 3-keto-5-aminohexanoate cleavage protein [Bacilli bacterium]
MDKLIITCAISGAEVTKEMNPAVPYTIEEMVEAAFGAYQAGASIIHLHARFDDGTPTQDKERFQLIHQAIQKKCPDVIIQVSTGGAVGMSRDERLDVLNIHPEMATLDCGTLNFGGDDIFVNTENDIQYFAEMMNTQHVRYEMECFEKGHIDTTLRFIKKGVIKNHLHYSFVLGVRGGMSGEERDFLFLKDSIPEEATFSVAGIGKYEFSLAELSIRHGGHVRVGLEDNLYIDKGHLAKSNRELVEKVVSLANKHGRLIATPKDTRRILEMENK